MIIINTKPNIRVKTACYLYDWLLWTKKKPPLNQNLNSYIKREKLQFYSYTKKSIIFFIRPTHVTKTWQFHISQQPILTTNSLITLQSSHALKYWHYVSHAFETISLITVFSDLFQFILTVTWGSTIFTMYPIS